MIKKYQAEILEEIVREINSKTCRISTDWSKGYLKAQEDMVTIILKKAEKLRYQERMGTV